MEAGGTGHPTPPTMNFKRIFRGPLFWIVLAVLLVLVIADVVSQSGGYEKVDTSEVIAAIQEGEAETVTLIDRDQEVRVDKTDGSKIKASYIEPQGALLTELVQENPPPGGQKTILGRFRGAIHRAERAKKTAPESTGAVGVSEGR